MKEQPECTSCGSREFVLIQVLEFDIDGFNEHGEPITYSGKEVLESEIKCSLCRTPKE